MRSLAMQSTHYPLDRAIRGDLDAFAYLLGEPGVGVEIGRSRPGQMLTPQGVRRVLMAFRHRKAPPELVQQWASFMRRGYLPDHAPGAVSPVTIDYHQPAESAIVEIIARLDEIGDEIDGEISSEEIDDMLRSLPE
jgi:hypothetical protein